MDIESLAHTQWNCKYHNWIGWVHSSSGRTQHCEINFTGFSVTRQNDGSSDITGSIPVTVLPTATSVAGIIIVPQPAPGDTLLTMPDVPEGFSIEILRSKWLKLR